VVLTKKIGEGDLSDPKTRNSSLTAMRIAMTGNIDVVVAVGGKLHLETGFNPGVLEELAQARWHGAPCFIVGALGGAAGGLELPILQELCEGNLLEQGDVPPEELAIWTDTMDEYVGKLLAHLARHRDQFAKTRPTKYGLAMSRSIQVEEVRDSTLGGKTKVVSVDPGVVDTCSSRFSQLLRAVERKNPVETHSLLNETGF
jgi:hypothetical protein